MAFTKSKDEGGVGKIVNAVNVLSLGLSFTRIFLWFLFTEKNICDRISAKDEAYPCEVLFLPCNGMRLIVENDS